jgi:hypothetical protein
MHLGCSIGLAVGESCQSSRAGWVLGGIPAESPSARQPSAFGKTVRSMLGLPSGGGDRTQARPSRRCHTTARKTGLDDAEA